jgi:hypothetical protein
MDDEEKTLCFNWKNTMPLLGLENMQKSNCIIPNQIKKHSLEITVFSLIYDKDPETQHFIPYDKIYKKQILYARHLNNRELP